MPSMSQGRLPEGAALPRCGMRVGSLLINFVAGKKSPDSESGESRLDEWERCSVRVQAAMAFRTGIVVPASYRRSST